MAMDICGKKDQRSDGSIGVIAGGGQFPLIFARSARRRGYRVVAAAYRGEADPRLADEVAALQWLHLGQVSRLITFLRGQGVRRAVMLGSISKRRLFTDVRPDARAIRLMLGVTHTHDDGMLRAFADCLTAEGIEIAASTFLLPELLAPAGCWTRRTPGRAERADIELGWRVAREIGRLDIGQCVVVSGGTVLAVEAIEGTDAAIRRGGRLGDGRAVVVKVCKPTQDRRFDMPATGLGTIETMLAAGARLLAVDAGRAVVFDRDRMVELADRHKICIVGVGQDGAF